MYILYYNICEYVCAHNACMPRYVIVLSVLYVIH